MKNQPRTDTRLFFIEFLIVLFFFFLVCTVCLKLFAGSHQLTEKAEALSQAQTLASSIIETYEASSSLKEEAYSQFFDQDFLACAEEEAVYVLSVTRKAADTISAAADHSSLPTTSFLVTVSVTKTDGTDVYTLSAQLHKPISYKELLL